LEEAAKLARGIGEKRGGEWDRGEAVAREIEMAIRARASRASASAPAMVTTTKKESK
jgi:hypothetical protein